MTVGTLLLANLQDVLSGGAKEAIEALFSTPGTPDAFAAGCALATSLDTGGWNLFSTAVLPLVLSSTARYIGQVEEGSTPLAFGEVSPAANSLSLLARLAWSGRLFQAAQAGGPAIKIWERTIGPVCEQKIKAWATSYSQGSTAEAEVNPPRLFARKDSTDPFAFSDH